MFQPSVSRLRERKEGSMCLSIQGWGTQEPGQAEDDCCLFTYYQRLL